MTVRGILDRVPRGDYNEHVKFLADNMLGKLATWLRLLGYDTAYLPHADDPELAGIARAEDRVLLTRDVELTHRRALRTLLVESEQVEEQLVQVFRTYGLSVRQAFSRCAICNVPLQDADKSTIESDIPPYVRTTQDQFRRCPQCGRVYWRGTHWAHMIAQIQDTLGPSETDTGA
jgi:uncharacterized protein with PIN domain